MSNEWLVEKLQERNGELAHQLAASQAEVRRLKGGSHKLLIQADSERHEIGRENQLLRQLLSDWYEHNTYGRINVSDEAYAVVTATAAALDGEPKVEVAK